MLYSKVEDTHFPQNNYIRIQDKLLDLSIPRVMGIINCTPDSFYAKSRNQFIDDILFQAEKHISEGADFLDIGGYSSRPGAKDISIEEEIERILPAVKNIRENFSTIPISLDTFRGKVAEIGLDHGVDIINDISGFSIDISLLEVLKKYKPCYILMHMTGSPQTMKQLSIEGNLFKTLANFFSQKINTLEKNGIHDIILDLGFGFGKTLDQNFELIKHLETFQLFGKPILTGISRKSMIYNKLKTTPEEALNGTTILNTLAVLKGTSIIRVHDVKEAKEIISLIN